MAYQKQAKQRASDFASDYANIRTIPAVLSVAYIMAASTSSAGSR